jgi:hypothetical protein
MAAIDYISKDQIIMIQPALFDVSEDGTQFRQSEASMGLTALGTARGWKTMGKMYVDGKLVEPPEY